ncbi:MAG: alpha/beta fold hydrolase [Proteobacteria bacterium]|nr:alpha/beta fold hydrolase [Burkholderiales bacterium]
MRAHRDDVQHTITSDGIDIAYRIDDFTDPWARAPTVVMLHSAMSSMRRLYALVPYFARTYRVVRMDLRGHGCSAVPPADTPLTLARLTQDLVELLDHLGITTAHLLGVSGGGYLAQRLAIEDPARVSSLLLFASRPGFKDSNGAAWIPEMERRGLRTFIAETLDERLPTAQLSQPHIDWFLDEIARNDPVFVRRFVLYMTTQYWMPDLARIRCPTLIVAPAGDSIGNASAYDEMQRLIIGSERLDYESANHNICDYLPDRCARDAMSFLQRRFPNEGRP